MLLHTVISKTKHLPIKHLSDLCTIKRYAESFMQFVISLKGQSICVQSQGLEVFWYAFSNRKTHTEVDISICWNSFIHYKFCLHIISQSSQQYGSLISP